MTKIALKLWLIAGMFSGLTLSACQGGTIVDEKTPLDTKIARLGDTVVAEVDGTSIFLSDIEHAALVKGRIQPGQLLTPKDAVFQTVLDELVDQRLLALEALRRSLDQNDEARRRLAAARERILATVVVEQLLAEKVTDESVQRIYDEQRALQGNAEQVRARHIVVETEERAKEIKDLVEKGGDFSTLAKEFSVDQSTGDIGGDLGYFSRNAMEDAIASVAFALKKGDVSEPFETSNGWHILTTINRRAMPRPPLKTIRPEIVSFMTYEEIQKLLKSLRANSDIQLMTGKNPAVIDTNKVTDENKDKAENKDAP